MLPRQQRGVLVLFLLLMLLLFGSSFVLEGFNTRQAAFLDQQKELHRQMELAKANLLAYAANSNTFYSTIDGRGPGFLPCPDTSNSGQPDSMCDPNMDMPVLGRLPQYQEFSGTRFKLNDTYAGIDKQFWYIVAPRYVYNSTTSASRRSNTRTAGDTSGGATTASPYWLNLDGESRYVALIIAPGDELSSQNRSAGSTTYSNYIDGQNGGDGRNFYTSYNSNRSEFNDQILGITFDDYFKLISMRAAITIKNELETYYTTNMSYPANQAAFNLEMTNSVHPVWMQTTSGTTNNGEAWGDDVTYMQGATSDEAKISFAGCSGMIYTLNHMSNTVTRSANSCL